jgi:hypothetical protein
LQWVNAGFAAAFGWGAPNNFATPERLRQLSQPLPEYQEMRSLIVSQFRAPDRDGWSPVPWPWTYGDAMNVPTPPTPRAFSALSPTQLSMLAQWAAGDFDADYDPGRQPPRSIDDLPISQQPAMLDKAALDFCLADAFHPGCEMTWPMRQASMYMSPFRIRHAAPDSVEPPYGARFTSELLNPRHGPMVAQQPGGITRWMAVPWQTDTASCQSGYPPPYAPYLSTFWPARVPNQVLTKDNYDVVMAQQRPLGERLVAFAQRASWLRPLGSDYLDQINNLVANISQMGVVETRPGPQDDQHFPSMMQVEDLPTSQTEPAITSSLSVETSRSDLATIDKVRRFPYGLKG